MLLSVIIAASRLNELEDCLISLNNQEDKNFEVIIVTNSNEKKSFKNFKFPFYIYKSEVNHPSIMRNLGVKKSKGDYLTFIDDDTFIPGEWTKKLKDILKQYPDALIGGPNRDKRNKFKYAFAQEIQEHQLLEGLQSHKKNKREFHEVNRHNLPLCNMALSKKIFSKIGGFNEKASYYVDDAEFNYIAVKSGYKLLLFNELEIQHNIRPLFFPYFKYKFISRFRIGENFLIFPEVYFDSSLIKFILLSYFFIPILTILGIKYNLFLYFGIIIVLYFVVLTLFSLKYIRKLNFFILLPISVFFVHLLSYVGFSLGLIKAFFLIKKNNPIKSYKKVRYNAFKK